MATLVLTAVGTALGGPVGGLLGAVAGQAIDARWLTPGGRRGPRLSDLRVQTSSYGTPVPRLFGRMRVAGTVIWATDLVEHRQRRSNGKGQPRTTTYSYSASFAVALSSRPILSVGRIWADGNILRGSDGAFAEQTGFRLHAGSEDQGVDPLIASAEGPDAAPAYRGLAYVVFEDLDLSAFGNRIPSLTFEVEADAGALTIADPAAEIVGDLSATGAPAMTGYALSGGSQREALAPLAPLLPLARTDGGWRVSDAAGPAAALVEPRGVDRTALAERRLGAVDRLPRALTLAHYDPARDFQTSVQTASVPGGGGAADAIDLPLAADAVAARTLAEREAASLRAGQHGALWPGGLAALGVRPGAIVEAAGSRWRVTGRRIEGGVALLDLSAVASGAAIRQAADGGRAVTSPDLATGDTVAALFDLPALVPGDVDQLRLVLAAAGTGPGWRRAPVSLEPRAGAAEVALGTVNAVSVIGSVTAVSGAGTTMVFDDASAIEVTLARGDMQLANADDADLLAGANLAIAGGELFQFGHAAPLGEGRWRLTRLLRGRRGSGAGAMPGMAFAMIDDPALLPVGDAALNPGAGGAVTIGATGAAAAITVPILSAGAAQRPLAPVQLRSAWQADGGLLISWIRRSRTGFDWRDGVDVPLDAGVEAYVVRVIAGAINDELTCAEPQLALPATDIAAWRAAGATGVVVAVSQVGALAASAPVTADFAL